MSRVQKITPCLWFDDQAEEAAAFYVVSFQIPRSGRSRVMERQGTRSTVGRQARQ